MLTPNDPGAHARRWHHALLYSTEQALLEGAATCASNAFRPGHAVVLMLTKEHMAAFRAHAARTGLDLPAAEAAGQLVPLDTMDFFDRISMDGRPSGTRFRVVMPGLLHMLNMEFPDVHVFADIAGTLVAQGNPEGALRLEQLCNELGEEMAFELVCAYPAAHANGPDGEAFMRGLNEQHGAVRSA